MPESQLQEKQFDLLLPELRRIGDSSRRCSAGSRCWRRSRPAMMELSRLSRSLESLAYAALGREGPRSAAAGARSARPPATAIAIPIESISTSTGVPWRPSTNVWCNSSVAA